MYDNVLQIIPINLFDDLDLLNISSSMLECEIVIAFVKGFVRCNVSQMSGDWRSCARIGSQGNDPTSNAKMSKCSKRQWSHLDFA